MPYRYNMIMQVSTAPDNTEAASSHVGGWSESHWHQSPLSVNDAALKDLLQARARMLPHTAAIVGVRIANYEIVNSTLRPLGASTSKIRQAGNMSYLTDLPQVALELSGGSNLGNGNRFSCRCIPDSQMQGGEYQPAATFKGYVTQFTNILADRGWGFIGRSLTALQPKILSIANGVLTTSGPLDAVVGETLVTFISVKDANGTPVVGNFRVTELVGDFQFRLEGLPSGLVVGASGYARKLTPIFVDYTSVTPIRAVVRKVGRPFEQYRGRASKRRTVA